MEAGTGFALDEYAVPRYGSVPTCQGGTIPKDAKEKGGLFSEVHRRADFAPGPDKYHKEILNQSFVQNAKGGGFSKLKRDWGKMKNPTPSVGDYETDFAKDKMSPRVKGGCMSKTDRKCIFWDQAVRNAIPAPGKYDARHLQAHLECPSFNSPKTSARVERKVSPLGPGYYNVDNTLTEKRALVYSGSKEDAKSFLDKLIKNKDATPAPGHVDVSFTKVEDRTGKALHSARLLLDRHIAPRSIDSAR